MRPRSGQPRVRPSGPAGPSLPEGLTRAGGAISKMAAPCGWRWCWLLAGGLGSSHIASPWDCSRWIFFAQCGRPKGKRGRTTASFLIDPPRCAPSFTKHPLGHTGQPFSGTEETPRWQHQEVREIRNHLESWLLHHFSFGDLCVAYDGSRTFLEILEKRESPLQ